MNNRQRGVSQDELSSIYQMHDRIQAIAEPDRAVEVAASSLALNLLPNGCIRDSSGPTQTTRLSRTGCLRFLTSSVTFRRSLIRSTLVAFNWTAKLIMGRIFLLTVWSWSFGSTVIELGSAGWLLQKKLKESLQNTAYVKMHNGLSSPGLPKWCPTEKGP